MLEAAAQTGTVLSQPCQKQSSTAAGRPVISCQGICRMCKWESSRSLRILGIQISASAVEAFCAYTDEVIRCLLLDIHCHLLDPILYTCGKVGQAHESSVPLASAPLIHSASMMVYVGMQLLRFLIQQLALNAHERFSGWFSHQCVLKLRSSKQSAVDEVAFAQACCDFCRQVHK